MFIKEINLLTMSKQLTSTLIVVLSSLFFYLFFPTVLNAAPLDWGTLQPNLKGLPFIADSGNPADETECLLCHEKYIQAFGKTKHAQALFDGQPGKLGSTCETCHGPLGRHLKTRLAGGKKTARSRNPKPRFVFSFKRSSAIQKNKVCLQCHESRNRVMSWQGSSHEMTGLSCDRCHYISKQRSRKNLLKSKDPKKVCFQCHRDKRAKMMRTSHMPLREGKINCSSCHNPHGGDGPSLLNQSSVNLTCFTCHQEKRGPFIWEHVPVRENCSNCHDPHGSNFRPLLKHKMPFLCQQCHMQVFHPGDIYDNRKLGASSRLGGKSCVNCHSIIHGSNHPAGAKLQR